LLLCVGVLCASTAQARCPPPPPAQAAPPALATEISIATLNLWRLRDTRKDARYDKPLPEKRLERRLRALAGHIHDDLSLPHLLAVQEVENLALLERLASLLQKKGAAYRAVLIEGNDPSGIDVGLLYRPPVIVDEQQTLFSEQGWRGGKLFSRPPLSVGITAPLDFQLIVVHLRSARGLAKPDSAGDVRGKRRAQAARLDDWLDQRAGQNIIVAGDLNSAPGRDVFSEPYRVLSDNRFSAWSRLPDAQRWSHIYRCQRQALDHLIVTGNIVERVTRAAVSRGNAGHHRELYASHGTGSAVSDHDALVVYLQAFGTNTGIEQIPE
jgi:predicted extracellular nuclease